MKLTNSLKPYVLFLLLFCCTALQAQVFINEFSAANLDDHLDPFGDNSDWIELYNAGSSTVDLSGYFLSDNITNLNKWTIPTGVSINAGDHLLIYASGRDQFSGFAGLHAGFKLTQSKNEYILLVDPSSVILDAYQITISNQTNHSRGRMTDGASDWGVFLNPTPGSTNTNARQEYASRPIFGMAAGFYNNAITVELLSEANTEIRYTIDGTEPNSASLLYTGPINISATTALKARSYSNDNTIPPSFIETNTYFINEEHTLPVFSVSSSEITNLLGGSGGAQPVTHLEYFSEDKDLEFEMTGHFKSHGNDSWALPQRGIRFYVKDYYGYAHKIDYKLFPTSERTDFDVVILKASASDNFPGSAGQWGRPSCHLRDAYVQSLSDNNDLNLDPRRYRRCIMYVNGEYWGVYEIRERIDSDYTKFYYDQGESWVDMLEYWGGLDTRYGSSSEWSQLYDFMIANDLSVASNFDYVSSELDLSSLIDYVILNTFVVNTDWLNWNTKWWRGRKGAGTKWRYCLWDMDNVFNLGQNFTGLPTTGWQSDPCDVENIFGSTGNPEIGHIEMLVALFENEDFVQMYINRYADLASTVFTCDNMLSYFDEMVAEIQPEMARQIDRWGGSYSQWEGNLEFMREEIENKCVVITTQVVDCYQDEGIMGPYDLQIKVIPPLSGNVQINSATGTAYPWNATYFGGVEINLTAQPNLGWDFDHWEVDNNIFGPDQFADAINMSLTTNDVITAYFTGGCTVDAGLMGPELICDGETVELTAAAGFASYTWSDNSNGNTLMISTPGVYSVTVIDAAGCVGYGELAVNANLPPLLSIEGQNYFCNGGTALLDAGVGFTTYLWSTNAITQIIEPGVIGVYTVTVTNEQGCTAEESIEVLEDTANPVSIDGPTELCAGTMSILTTNGNYEMYQWSNNTNESNLSINAPGIYSVTVTDIDGCTSTSTIEVAAGAALNPSISGNTIMCDGAGTQLDAGSGFTTYNWSNGSNGQVLNIVDPDVYSVTVTNAQGCTGVDFVNVEQITVQSTSEQVNLCYGDTYNGTTYFSNANLTEMYQNFQGCDSSHLVQLIVAPELTIGLSSDSGCGFLGSIEAQAQGGNGSFTYNWSDGSTGAQLGNLFGGTYTVTVSDQLGCTQVASENVVLEPGISIDYDSESVSCSGDMDGWIDLQILVGTPPYEVNWSNGAIGTYLEGLDNGTYVVLINDAAGCNLSTSIELGDPGALNVEIATTLAGSGNNGTATAMASGGTTPYTYQWNTGATTVVLDDLIPGEYVVTVTDANGCITIDEAFVSLTSTHEIDQLLSVQLFPNPASDYFILDMELNQSELVNLTIMDISGKVVKEDEQNGREIHFNVDVSDLAQGTYLVFARLGKGYFTEKIIVVR